MFRGILSTIYLETNDGITINYINSKLKIFYKNDFFVKILPINSYLSTNDIINTNYCYLSVCKTKYKNKFIILSAIDNLIKGGAGQAIQNLNYYFGYNVKKGLL